MTIMLRRSDVISAMEKEIREQQIRREHFVMKADAVSARHTNSRLDTLRILRAIIMMLPKFQEAQYASADMIPAGNEWGERIRIAGEATDAPNESDVAMSRLLADLRKPLPDLIAAEKKHAIAA